MGDLQVILEIAEKGGGTGVLLVIAYLMWRIDRNIYGFTAAFKESQKLRDGKLNDIHNDLKRLEK